MPIPSPAPYRRSNLTKEQKQEALNAIYGVSMSKLTEQEIEKMRELVASHDAENGEESDFDPSKVRVPYKFQKFPMMVYNHERSYPAHDKEITVTRGSLAVLELTHIKAHLVSKTVHKQHELDAALASGWSETPPEFKEVDEEAEPLEAAPVRRGRPRTNVA